MFRIPLTLIAAIFLSASLSADEHRFQHENVLGTSLTLDVHVASPQLARTIESESLTEIGRLDAIFSSYRDDSELSRWLKQPVGVDAALSVELIAVLQRAERIRRESHGAFDIRAAAIAELWKNEAKAGRSPSDASRNQMVQALAEPAVSFSNERVRRLTDHRINLDSLAKGYILDRVCEVVSKHLSPGDRFSINVGGDLRTIGDGATKIVITDPRRPSENAKPLVEFTAHGEVAVATSGTYRRSLQIGEREVSHLFDPRSALPVGHTISASVIAADAITADALATTISVLPTHEAIQWIDAKPGCECLIVDEKGKVHRSANWPAANPSPASRLIAAADAKQAGIHVWFKLERPSGSSYRRPYLAVWLEDEDGFPVKTAVLWMQTEQPGPRWHRDLTRWYRNDRMRKIVEKTDLIEAISGATRGPGEYEAHFDGTDNSGEPLPTGRYTLCLEAARENGTYKIIRQRIDWGTDTVEKTQLKGNIEIPQAAYQIVPAVQ
ncbi:DUF2271 domain-containing protein [Rosistilla oblonga]|uniref:DUF2271 domain-containing protein n=1 Tax=Rosistilla oblonga TaxID=2527990 RepID=UPI003A97E4A0